MLDIWSQGGSVIFALFVSFLKDRTYTDMMNDKTLDLFLDLIWSREWERP